MSRIVGVGEHFPQRATEWLVAAILITWGVEAAFCDALVWNLPVNTYLRNLGSQEMWGMLAATIGIVRVYALIRNGAWRPSPHFRAAGAFLSLFFWLQLTLGLMLSDYAPLAVAVYPWLLVADFYNATRAARDAKVVDLGARRGELAGDTTAA